MVGTYSSPHPSKYFGFKKLQQVSGFSVQLMSKNNTLLLFGLYNNLYYFWIQEQKENNYHQKMLLIQNCEDLKKLESGCITSVKMEFIKKGKIDDTLSKLISQSLALSQALQILNLDFKTSNNTDDYLKESINDSGISIVSIGIAQCLNLTQFQIDLSATSVGTLGLQMLCQGLVQCPLLALISLNLSECFRLGKEQATIQLQQLSKCKNLESFSFNILKQFDGGEKEQRSIFNIDQGVALCQHLSYLKLELAFNQIGDEGLQKLSVGISLCQNLLTLILKLKNNKIKSEGISGLGQNIPECKHLQHFEIDLSCSTISQSRNMISSDGVINLSQGLGNCKNITTLILNFSNNRIRTDLNIIFFQNVSKIRNLHKLYYQFQGNGTLNIKGLKQRCYKLLRLVLAKQYY